MTGVQTCALPILLKARLEKAKLMGYENYASFALEERMAKTPDAVYKLLDQIWTPTPVSYTHLDVYKRQAECLL